MCSYVRAVCEYERTTLCVDVRGQLQELVLFFYHVGARDGIQAIGKSSH